jgi:hypothetical protein
LLWVHLCAQKTKEQSRNWIGMGALEKAVASGQDKKPELRTMETVCGIWGKEQSLWMDTRESFLRQGVFVVGAEGYKLF